MRALKGSVVLIDGLLTASIDVGILRTCELIGDVVAELSCFSLLLVGFVEAEANLVYRVG